MLRTDQILRVYEDLAYQYDRQGQARLRDCYFVLAADAAYTLGWEDEAERLRIQLLSFNPHHLLRPYVSFSDALRSPDIQSYIEDLRLTHPPEAAERELKKPLDAGKAPPAAEKFPAPGPVKQPVAPPNNGQGVDDAPTYRLKDEPAKPRPKPPAPPVVRVAPTVSKAAANPGCQPARKPKPNPSDRSQQPAPLTTPRKRKPAPAPEEPSAGSRFFTSFLFALLLLAGLAVAVYIFVAPFLPPEWWP